MLQFRLSVPTFKKYFEHQIIENKHFEGSRNHIYLNKTMVPTY